jgi:hypothetical protein
LNKTKTLKDKSSSKKYDLDKTQPTNHLPDINLNNRMNSKLSKDFLRLQNNDPYSFMDTDQSESDLDDLKLIPKTYINYIRKIISQPVSIEVQEFRNDHIE